MSRRTTGFTLLELLLSVTLLAVLVTAVGAMITGVLGGAGRINAAVEEDAAAAEIEDLIADDLGFLAAPVKPPGSGAAPASSTAPSSTASSSSAHGIFARPPVSIRADAGGSSMSFFSAAGSKTAWGDIATQIHRVEYSLRPSPVTGQALFRWEEPIVKTEGAYYDQAVLVAEGVTAFKVEGFDGRDWRDEWPAQGAGALPLLIRVSIDLARADGGTRKLLVESAPGIEFAVRPEAERRASGGGEAAAGTSAGALDATARRSSSARPNVPAGDEGAQ